MAFSRRTFAKAMLSGIPFAFWQGRAFVAPSWTPSLGLNTWSLRALKHDQAIPTILRVMKETGVRDCQLLFSHAEPEEFDPDFASMGKPPTPEQGDEQKRKSEARTAWRLSVPMTYFEALRAQFDQQGLTIRAYAAQLGGSAEEIDRIFLMAKTMGCTAVTGGLPEAQTDLVAAAAERHRLLVGMQVRDLKLVAQQLRASPRLDQGRRTRPRVRQAASR
jgi:methylmalonyl-CoA mutase cobalamin-binding subunit